MEYTFNMMQEAADYIAARIVVKPAVGLILGSGLGVLGDDVEEAVYIPWKFPISPYPRFRAMRDVW